LWLRYSPLVASYHAPRPARLPGTALGWAFLFNVERASAVLAVIGTVLLVGWRATHGEFPIRFGNIEYADELNASAETVESHEARRRLVESLLRLAGPPGQPVESWRDDD
jgi:hypothetical protein